MSFKELCVVMGLLCLAVAQDNKWGEHSHLDEPHTLTCNDTAGLVFVNVDDKLNWTRLGSPDVIMNDDHYELRDPMGIPNMELHVKKVTIDMEGVYFCHVYNQNGHYIGRVVKGLNVGRRLYDDLIDKYDTHIVRGVIAGASVFVLIVGLCFIDRFRYLSKEEKEERRLRKEARVQRLKELKNGFKDGGYENAGMDNGVVTEREGKSNNLPDGYDNTHL